MTEPEFDRYASSYRQLHAENIKVTGESPEYFAEYKARHAARLVAGALPVPRVLDFGCGIGNSTGYLARHFPGSRIAGADVSSKSLEVARSRNSAAIEFATLTGGRTPYEDASFGLVFVSCVLHHVPPAEHSAMLAEFRRVLAPGGWLLSYEHNPWNPLTVRAVESCEFDRTAILLPAGELRRKVAAAGFTRARTYFIVFFPSFLRFLRWSEPLLAWLPLGAQYAVAARK